MRSPYSYRTKRKSRWDGRRGRMKPCQVCGKEFWCVPSRDIPGSRLETKYCSQACVREAWKSVPTEHRFWEKVDKRGPEECWLWTAALQRDVRRCVNPAHLFLATHDENMKDAKAKDRHARGERNHHAKLTDEQVKQILALHRGAGIYGEHTRLAKMLGVSPAVVGHVVRGATWKHIPRPESK